MTDLASFPTSIRQRLEEAQTLLSRGRVGEAEAIVQQAMVSLASSSPELYVLLASSQQGYRQLTSRHVEASTHYERVPKYIFGIEVGIDIERHTTTRTIVRTWRLD